MFDRKEIKEKSRIQLAGKWGVVGGACLILLLMALMIEWLPRNFQLATLILGGPIAFGEYMIGYRVSRGEKVSIEDVFSGFINFGRALGMYLWMALWTFLWMLLLIIPGIIKAYSYSMAFYILIDHPEMSVGDALKESMVITEGYKMDLFLLDLSFWGWGILSVMTFGIGFFWLIPYIQTSGANTYQFLKRI